LQAVTALRAGLPSPGCVIDMPRRSTRIQRECFVGDEELQ